MSLNSLESEGLRPLCSLSLVQCLLWGKCLCDQSLSTITVLVNGSPGFHFGFVFYSEAQIPVFVRRQLEFQGGCGPTLDINCPAALWTSILNSGWATCVKMAKPYYCSGSWMAVGRACCQWEMLHYGNKITSESSPSFLPSQRHLLWLFSDHFCCKIRHKSRFEILVQCFFVQMLANVALSICCEGL